ncbi:MAG TPA: RNA pseudouridine synthase [Verrucomicrobia bacterium]|nr:MAG: RNA pseudouridine synthase [Lentisphaerae bacterium GWF2_57_35]HBA83304.1 RNA pseudouridine synthase [Verrucomicrobiota bacterium]
MPKKSHKPDNRLPHAIRLLYEDRDILVVDKPPGLLTMGTDKEKTRTLYYILTDYIRKGYSKSSKRIFIVHRLDREASGLLVFTKTEEAKYALQDHWEEAEKKYVAIVHGRLAKKEGVITSYLTENAAHNVYSTSDRAKGKLSSTEYKVVQETKDFSLLEIKLLTGRKHQIRVHLADSGHPIVGDKKYGQEDRINKRLALHAVSLAFKHPYSGEPQIFESRAPGYFVQLMREHETQPIVSSKPEGFRRTAFKRKQGREERRQP